MERLASFADKLSPPQNTLQKIKNLQRQAQHSRKTAVLAFKASDWVSEGQEEDYRNISVFPTSEEIFSVEKGQISAGVKPNIINGQYRYSVPLF